MAYKDTIRLTFDNNLILGNSGSAMDLKQIIHKHTPTIDIESYGLFDSAAPNFATYYPEVKPEDLKPRSEDFVEPVFRALSEVIVHKLFNPVDFSMHGILKKSTQLLKGLTVYPNHEMMVGNELGAVAGVDWEEATKLNGVDIPAGINAKLKIDGKSHPNIARAIMMEPPSIHSTSVRVEFEWEKSHDMKEDEFYNKLATKDKDGALIRRIATKVNNYHELSLVGHGADPFAQKKDKDGNINNPRYAGQVYNSAERQAQKYFIFDFKRNIIENSEENTIPSDINDNNTPPNNTDNMNNVFLLAFAKAFGLLETATQADVDAKIAELNLRVDPTVNNTELARLRAIETEHIAAKPKLTQLETLIAAQTANLEKVRNRVTAIYNKVMEGKADAAITAMIAGQNEISALEALETQYQTQLDHKFPSKCKKCGSTEISKASAVQDDGKDKPDSDKKELDRETTIKNIQARKRQEQIGMSGFFGAKAEPKA